MDDIVIDRVCIVIIRIAVAVGSTAIGLAGGYAVAEHLYYILNGHFHAAHTGAVGSVVDPVLQMMLIPALMMQPCRAVALFAAFDLVRAAVALIIFCTGGKLHRTELAQIVRQSLPV